MITLDEYALRVRRHALQAQESALLCTTRAQRCARDANRTPLAISVAIQEDSER